MVVTRGDDPSASPWPRAILFAILLFLFGEKIDVIGKLLVMAIDTIKCDPSQDLYLIETSFLALGIGLSAATILAILKEPNAEKENLALIAGVFVGALAGFLTIVETMIFEKDAAKLSAKPFFFFAIYGGLFLLPALLALAGNAGQRMAIDRLARVSFAVVLGAIAGFLVWHLVGGVIWALPVFDYDGRVGGGVDRLTFRPLAFVWLGTIWAVVTFLRSGQERASLTSGGQISWVGLYGLSAGAVAAGYAIFFIGPEDAVHAASPIPTWLAFALVGATPIAACAFGDAYRQGIEGMRLGYASVAGFVLAFLGMMAGLAHGAGDSVAEKVIGAALFALGGALTPGVAFLSVRFAKRLLAARGNVRDTVEAST